MARALSGTSACERCHDPHDARRRARTLVHRASLSPAPRLSAEDRWKALRTVSRGDVVYRSVLTAVALVLPAVLVALTAELVVNAWVQLVSLDPDVFQKALEKLWTFGGAVVTPEGDVSRGKEGWQRAYEEQREHRKTQLVLMRRFADGPICRMLQLVRAYVRSWAVL